MAMHEYISEFTSIMEHAHSIKLTDTTSAILASNFIDGIQNPYIKKQIEIIHNTELVRVVWFYSQRRSKTKD